MKKARNHKKHHQLKKMAYFARIIKPFLSWLHNIPQKLNESLVKGIQSAYLAQKWSKAGSKPLFSIEKRESLSKVLYRGWRYSSFQPVP